jgi:hypothetical protein
MRFIVLTASVAVALASTPAFAQLAGAGNLVGTNSAAPTGPSSPHQSSTMVAAGGGTRGAIVAANGGDLLPGAAKGSTVPAPKSVSSNTPSKAAGGYVQAFGPNSHAGTAGARIDVANGLGSGPSNTYRDVTVNASGVSAAGAPKVNLPTH